MTKKQSGLSVQGKLAVRNVKHMLDKNIDFSDIPESTDQELKNAKRVGRPRSGNPKQLIALRIDPRLLSKLKKLALKKEKPYQTFIHELLEKVCKKAA